MINAIKEFMRTCPLLDENGKVQINLLGPEPIEYVIEGMPDDLVVKHYVDGTSIRQLLFVFGSKESYAKSEAQVMVDSGFHEKLSSWYDEKTQLGELPILPNGLVAQKIQVLTTGYALVTDEVQAKACYQIQCKLIYYKEKTT